MDYRGAIPSYHRDQRIGEATLGLLARSNIDMDRVSVFVNDDAEREKYTPTVRAVGGRLRVIGATGIGAARNCIARAYPVGTPLLVMDDDVTRFIRRVDAKTIVDVPDMAAVIEEGFGYAADTLWCVYPVPNPYFMRGTVRRAGLWFAWGAFYGYRVSNQPHELVSIDHAEDYERSIRFFEARGAVTRLDMYSFFSRIWKEPGGLQDTRTREHIDAGVRSITDRWPHLARRTVNAAGIPNVRLVTPKRV